MKKVVRILGLCALVALVATACKKNEDTEKTLTFTATINQPVNTAKTHIGDDNMLVWDANNSIKVFNANGVVGDFTTTDQDVAEATFTGTLPETETYTAFYPNAAVNGNAVTLELSANQNYVNNNFGNDTYPMAAPSTISGGNVNFNFHSPASVLRLILKSNNACTVGSITVTGGANDKLAGNIVYPDFSDVTECAIESASNSVTLNCGTGVQLAADEETAFNIVILSGTLSAGTTVVVKDINNNTIKTLTTSVANNIDVETIFTMPVQEISYQLPNVFTDAATNVSSNTGTINGHYTFPAGAPVTACGFYWGDNQAAVENGTSAKITEGTTATPMAHTFNTLEGNHTYYFKAWATNATGESCGPVLSFTTPAAVVNPSVQTVGHEITGTAAALTGAIVNDGNGACTVGFYYGTDPNLTTHSTKQVGTGYHTGDNFTWNWNNLEYNVTYYYQAYATNSHGTVTGLIKHFKIDFVGHFCVETVSETDLTPVRFVTFATGLLWWDDNAGEFAFENDQYSFHRWMDAEQGVTPNASFSQFCWSNEFNDYGKNNTPNQTGHDFVDWGNNRIRKSNSTEYDEAGTWRTLTYEEWECIIRVHKYIVRERNGMNYFVLLPYGMTTSQANSYNNNQLANMGAAFFPMCGNAVNDPGLEPMSWGFNSQICIWSATVNQNSGNWGQAGAVWMYTEGGGLINAGGLTNTYYHRMQVRLAQDEQ